MGRGPVHKQRTPYDQQRLFCERIGDGFRLEMGDEMTANEVEANVANLCPGDGTGAHGIQWPCSRAARALMYHRGEDEYLKQTNEDTSAAPDRPGSLPLPEHLQILKGGLNHDGGDDDSSTMSDANGLASSVSGDGGGKQTMFGLDGARSKFKAMRGQLDELLEDEVEENPEVAEKRRLKLQKQEERRKAFVKDIEQEGDKLFLAAEKLSRINYAPVQALGAGVGGAGGPQSPKSPKSPTSPTSLGSPTSAGNRTATTAATAMLGIAGAAPIPVPKRKPGKGAKQLGDPLSEENLEATRLLVRRDRRG